MDKNLGIDSMVEENQNLINKSTKLQSGKFLKLTLG